MKKIFTSIVLIILAAFTIYSEEWVDGMNYMMLSPFEIGIGYNDKNVDYSCKAIFIKIPVGLLNRKYYKNMNILLGLDLIEMHFTNTTHYEFSLTQPSVVFKLLDKTHIKNELCFIDAFYFKINPLKYKYSGELNYYPEITLGNEFFFKKGLLAYNTFGMNIDYSIPIINFKLGTGKISAGIIYRFLGWHMQPK